MLKLRYVFVKWSCFQIAWCSVVRTRAASEKTQTFLLLYIKNTIEISYSQASRVNLWVTQINYRADAEGGRRKGRAIDHRISKIRWSIAWICPLPNPVPSEVKVREKALPSLCHLWVQTSMQTVFPSEQVAWYCCLFFLSN